MPETPETETKQQTIARAVCAAVGGRENIRKAYHCMTRLRLELKGDITDDLRQRLAAIPGVLGTNCLLYTSPSPRDRG